MKVKKKHLVGEIADFPKHVVQAMVDEQVRQGNMADPRVFADMTTAGLAIGGFDWFATEAGWGFWQRVLEHKQFDFIPKPTKPIGHVHAKQMKQYAKDAKVSKTPWELWEHRSTPHGTWCDCTVNPAWLGNMEYRRKSDNQVEPEAASKEQPTPNAIIRAMLDKGLIVWAATSDHSYDDARSRMDRCMRRVFKYDDSDAYPVRMKDVGWRYAIPVDTTTSTEITELP